jgi:hypothetical protein
MLDLIWDIRDYFPQIYEYADKVIDVKLFGLGAGIIAVYEIITNAAFLQKNAFNLVSPDLFPLEPGYSETFHWYPFGSFIPLLIILLVFAAFINRKMLIYLQNRKSFFDFYESLDKKTVNDSRDFKKICLKYEKIGEILNTKFRSLDAKSNDDGITLIFRELRYRYGQRSKFLRRNYDTKLFSNDIEYQQKIQLYDFIQIICDFEIQYTPEKHLEIKDEFITKPLKQIQLENELITIIVSCHTDGKGFLSTLALENMIAISLSLPHKDRIKILEILKSVPTKNIGWLNRRLFEIILVNVALHDFSAAECSNLRDDIKKLDAEISVITPRLTFDERVEKIKTDFREGVSNKYRSMENLKNV